MRYYKITAERDSLMDNHAREKPRILGDQKPWAAISNGSFQYS